MVVKRCIICNKCTSRSSEDGVGTISMFKCPAEEQRRKLWSKICGMEISEISFVCINHFTTNSIKYVGKHPRLLPDAVPSLNIKTEASKGVDSSTEADHASGKHETEPSLEMANLNDLPIKAEPLEIEPAALINEELFDELETCQSIANKGAAGSLSQWTCGKIDVNLETDNLFSINCVHCRESFSLTEINGFVQHMKDKHLPMVKSSGQTANEKDIANNSMLEIKIEEEEEDLPEVMEESGKGLTNIKTTEILLKGSTILRAKNEERTVSKEACQDSEDTTSAPKAGLDDAEMDCDEDNVNNLLELEDSGGESEDDPDEKSLRKEAKSCSSTSERARKFKKTKIDVEQISVESTDADLVQDFLVMLKDYPILWHRRQSAMKLYDNAIAELMPKFNAKHQLTYSDVSLRESISRLKLCFKRPTFSTKYPEFHQICTELEENSKKITQNCDRCASFFFNEIDLQIHRFKTHRLGELPFKCKRCKYGFSNQASLEKHELNHERKRRFKCPICARDFFYEKMLETHIKAHENYVCEICGKSFESLSHFKRHKLHHEPPQEKCEICGKAYYDKWLLSEHLKMHKNERNFKCQECNKSFNQRQGLRIHLRGVHKIKSKVRSVWVDAKKSRAQGDNGKCDSSCSDDDNEELDSAPSSDFSENDEKPSEGQAESQPTENAALNLISATNTTTPPPSAFPAAATLFTAHPATQLPSEFSNGMYQFYS